MKIYSQLKNLKTMNTKRLLLPICAIFLSIGISYSASPTDNPIATYYGNEQGYPNWTDNIQWDNVINMKTYDNGNNAFEKFENARDELYNQGGGVLYYPAGTYDFSDMPKPNSPDGRGLMLKKGVVIRGEAPSTDSAAIKESFVRYTKSEDMPDPSVREDHGLKSLGTVFQFPYFDVSPYFDIVQYDKNGEAELPGMWNYIGLMPESGQRLSDVTHVGIAWVHVKGGGVAFGPDRHGLDDGGTYNNAGGWLGSKVYCDGSGDNLWWQYDWLSREADGTHPNDVMFGVEQSEHVRSHSRFVFGCWFENVTNNGSIMNKCGNVDAIPKLIRPERFGARLTVYGSRVLVANNVLSKPTKSFLFRNKIGNYSEGTAPDYLGMVDTVLLFDYARSLGIDVNKQITMEENPADINKSQLYNEGVIVQDNYVFQTDNKPYEISGEYATFKNNIAYHPVRPIEGDQWYDYLDKMASIYWLYDYSGCRRVADMDDMMARGFDVGGHAVWMDNNWWDATASGPTIRTNDGEGILIQQNNWAVQCLSSAFTNNSEGPRGNQGGVVPYNVHSAGLFIAWNTVAVLSGLSSGVGPEKVSNQTQVFDASVVDNELYDGSLINGDDCPEDYMNCADPASSATVKDFMEYCPTGDPKAPDSITVTMQPSQDRAMIEWVADTSDHNEIGFRIDRSIDGGSTWHTIAYRPRHEYNWDPGKDTIDLWFDGNKAGQYGETAQDMNQQKWLDYTVPAGENVEYRVLSIGCGDSDNYAIMSDPVSVGKNQKVIRKSTAKQLSIAPNPASNTIRVDGVATPADYTIYNLSGSKVSSGTLQQENLSIEALPEGIYFIEINNAVTKFVKQ